MVMRHPTSDLPVETDRSVVMPPSPDDAVIIQRAIEKSYDDLYRHIPWAIDLQSLEETRDFLEAAGGRYLIGEDSALSGALKVTRVIVLGTGIPPRRGAIP
jgi:hypothetical protein